MHIDTSAWTEAYAQDPKTADIRKCLVDPLRVDHPWRERYELDNDLIYLRDADGPRRVYVPRAMQEPVLAMLHDSPLGGHHGCTKTYLALSAWAYFPHMRKTVTAYVNSCLVCARAKPAQPTATTPHACEVPPYAFHTISIDIVSGLPRIPYKDPLEFSGGDGESVDAVLTVVCALTRFVIFIPISKEAGSVDIANLIVQHVIIAQTTPVPEKIQSDRDPRWTSQLFRDIATKLGIRLALTTAYHAQSNGGAEIMNKILGNFLKAFTTQARDKWPHLLGYAARAYNTSWSTALRCTPAEARFGAAVLHAIGLPSSTPLAAPLARTRDAQAMAQRAARDALWNSKDSIIREEPATTRPALAIGDMVMVNVQALLPANLASRNRKTSPRFTGPYTIVGKVSPEAWAIKLPNRSRAHPTISIKYLKRYEDSDEFPDRPTQADREDLESFLVESILKHKRKRNRLFFLVRWLHYDKGHDSWEPVESFQEDDGTVHNQVLLGYLRENNLALP